MGGWNVEIAHHAPTSACAIGPCHDRSDRCAVCPWRPRRRKARDRFLGPLGSRRQQRHQGDVRGVGREGEGRDLDRLHHLAGQQEPPDHRRRGAGALRPRHLRVPDLGTAGPRAQSRARRRHHGRDHEGERRGQPDRRISRPPQRQMARGAGDRRQPDQGPVLAHRPDEEARRYRRAGDVSGRQCAQGRGLDARCDAQGRGSLPQGRPSVRDRARRDRRQCRHVRRDLPVVWREPGRRQGQRHGQDRRGPPGDGVLQEARAVPAAGRAGLGQRLQQQVPDLGQGRADHEPAELLGGRQARRAAGRRAIVDPRHAVGPEGPVCAVPAVLLGRLEFRQEQVRRQRACWSISRRPRTSRRWWPRARATTCRRSASSPR